MLDDGQAIQRQIRVVVHSGPHPTDPAVEEYVETGTLKDVQTNAQEFCLKHKRTQTKRVFIDFIDIDGVPLYHLIY